MKNIRNLSANVLQLVLNQVFGLGIFYLLSTGLSKTDFGQINLALAVLLAVFNILSMGIDQLVIKRIASGAPVQTTLSLYIGHVLLAGVVFYGILLSGKILFPHAGDVYNLVLIIGIGKLAMFFSGPFKQIASGLEKFRLLGYMSVISNAVRCLSLLAFVLSGHQISIAAIVIIFIAADIAELITCIYLFKYTVNARLMFKWDKANYLNLLKEALPQSGVVMITSALARFDWIFIGIILSAQKLAEYSFAYKVFEMATLPLTAIAPLLIPRFTNLFLNDTADTGNFKTLIRLEMIIAGLVALVLNVYWSPVIDGLTNGKYGAINVQTLLLLSLSMPLLYINNVLWTAFFAKGQLKMILRAFIVTLLVNVAGDITLIPLYKNEGAALAFLLANLAQTIFFLNKNTIPELKTAWQPLITCVGCAFGAGLSAKYLLADTWLVLPASVIIYFVLLILTAQIRFKGRQNLQALMNW